MKPTVIINFYVSEPLNFRISIKLLLEKFQWSPKVESGSFPKNVSFRLVTRNFLLISISYPNLFSFPSSLPKSHLSSITLLLAADSSTCVWLVGGRKVTDKMKNWSLCRMFSASPRGVTMSDYNSLGYRFGENQGKICYQNCWGWKFKEIYTERLYLWLKQFKWLFFSEFHVLALLTLLGSFTKRKYVRTTV